MLIEGGRKNKLKIKWKRHTTTKFSYKKCSNNTFFYIFFCYTRKNNLKTENYWENFFLFYLFSLLFFAVFFLFFNLFLFFCMGGQNEIIFLMLHEGALT